MRKKLKLLGIALSILVLFAFISMPGGCAPEDPEVKDPDVPDVPEQTFLSVGTGGTGGTWYVVWSAGAPLVTQESDFLRVDVTSTAGSLENIRLLKEGLLDIANSNPEIVYSSYHGEPLFGDFDSPHEEMRQIACGNYMPGGYVIVRADSDIYSMSDLEGKRISVGTPGSGTSMVNPAMLQSLGMEYDVDYEPYHLAHFEAADALIEGTIDVFTALSGVPFPAGTEVATRIDVRFIGLTEEEAEIITSDHPYWLVRDLPAGTYDGQDDPVPKLHVATQVVGTTDLPDDVVYEFLRILYDEQHDAWVAAHAVAKEFSIQSVKENIEAGTIMVPFHPGAIKFYEERGVSIPEEMKP